MKTLYSQDNPQEGRSEGKRHVLRGDTTGAKPKSRLFLFLKNIYVTLTSFGGDVALSWVSLIGGNGSGRARCVGSGGRGGWQKGEGDQDCWLFSVAPTASLTRRLRNPLKWDRFLASHEKG